LFLRSSSKGPGGGELARAGVKVFESLLMTTAADYFFECFARPSVSAQAFQLEATG
jgi:hypothetical protein